MSNSSSSTRIPAASQRSMLKVGRAIGRAPIPPAQMTTAFVVGDGSGTTVTVDLDGVEIECARARSASSLADGDMVVVAFIGAEADPIVMFAVA